MRQAACEKNPYADGDVETSDTSDSYADGDVESSESSDIARRVERDTGTRVESSDSSDMARGVKKGQRHATET